MDNEEKNIKPVTPTPEENDLFEEVEITEADFVLTEANQVKEQKFQTKPTTFLKDSFRRFTKNKSSVVAAFILGFLIILGVAVPIFSPYDVKNGLGDTAFANLEPRLFTNTNGFWDGTIKKEHIAVDTSSENQEDWLPDSTYFKPSGISNITYTDVEYTGTPTKFGRDGYFQVGYYGIYEVESAELDSLATASIFEDYRFTFDISKTIIYLDKFETVDETKIKKYESDSKEVDSLTIPANFVLGDVTLQFVYYGPVEDEETHEIVIKEKTIDITEKKLIHNVGVSLDGYETEPQINVTNLIIEGTKDADNPDGIKVFDDCFFRIKVEPVEDTLPNANVCSLIKNMVFSIDDTEKMAAIEEIGNQETKEEKLLDAANMRAYFVGRDNGVDGISFSDPMKMASRESTVKVGLNTYQNVGYWSIPYSYAKGIHLGKCRYASFTYDSYNGALGERDFVITDVDLEKYKKSKWIDYEIIISYNESTRTYYVDESTFMEPVIKSDSCPLVYKDKVNKIVFTIDDIMPDQSPAGGKTPYKVNCKIIYYRYLGYDKMPTFLFGTDKTSKDMFKYVFEGLRNSLALGVMTFIICFAFGLLWGSISGYFGGAVDLIMERITDILHGVPWIVVMTLVILKADNSSFGVFLLALCLTGWIGTASTTRTQFYRFRGREYVLASRTLGASDGRLIAKHILPNALGTIITGAVLMIPSVIFSEATISYLGLGFKNLSSLGVILSDNQSELTNHPYQLIFPSVVIALLMISFNLFGNGLRDAINPSLKGEEE